MTGTTFTSESSRHTPCAAAGSDGTRSAPATLHDQRGWFAKGNPGGPGNPHHRKVAGLREALLRIVTPEDVEEIARKLIDVAKEGSLQAIKLFLAYVIGKPGAVDCSSESAWEGYHDAMAWMRDMSAKMDSPAAAPSGSRQSSAAAAEGSGSRQTSGEASRNSGEFRDELPANLLPTVEAAVVQSENALSLNGGKRLTRQQRRALRRQAKGRASGNGEAPKVNGDNGWLLGAPSSEDPLAALARQRDLLREDFVQL